HTAETLASLRGISPQDVASLTSENVHRLVPTTHTTTA
ncbi:MAG: hypothetical protein JWP98_108, partial [Edaphobacter sp.]|nr:hypothetical protein [Edaphobacter sp.]